MKLSSSPSDAMPPHVFKEAFTTLGLSVLAIVDSSDITSVAPSVFKHDFVQTIIIKKGQSPNTRFFKKSWKK